MLKLTPNRITVYLTVFVNLIGAVYSVAASLNPGQAGGVVAALAGIDAVAIMFLRGWQQFEQANYTAQHMDTQLNAQRAAQAQATAPRSAVKLPR